MHWDANPEWYHRPDLVNNVIKLARAMSLGILLHTSEKETSKSHNFEKIIAENPDITFILAHGRPTNQAILILKKYNNVFVDTAFMDKEQMLLFTKEGLSKKIRFGTDMPINEFFYKDINTTEYVKKCVYIYRLIVSKV